MGALAESCFGNALGADLDLNNLTWNQLWAETGSVFVVSVSPAKKAEFEKHFGSMAQPVGTVTDQAYIQWSFAGAKTSVPTAKLQNIWAQGVQNVYEA